MDTEPAKIFETRFQNRLADLGHATEKAVRFVKEKGVSEDAVYVLNLAIEEMVTNILKYGYDDTSVHEILLRVEILSERLLLIIEDDGHEFNPRNAPEPAVSLSVIDRPPGGLGIHLVRKLAEEMRYERRDCRNRLTIAIRF